MKHSFKKLPGSAIELEAELTQEEFNKYYQPVFDQALSQVTLKGFRRGAAPKELADQAVNKAKVFGDAAFDAVRFSLNEIVQDNKWILIGKPEIDILSGKDGLKYKAKLILFPEIKIADYKKIAQRHIDLRGQYVEKTEVNEEEVNQSLEWLRKSRVKDGVVPEANDEFAKSLGKFENLADLKEKIKSGIVWEKQEKEKEKTRIKIIEEITAKSQMDVPQIMIEKTKETYKCSEEEARQKIAAHLIINEIAQKENLQPTEQELETELVKYQQGVPQVDKNKFYDYIYGIIQNKKVFEFLEKQ